MSKSEVMGNDALTPEELAAQQAEEAGAAAIAPEPEPIKEPPPPEPEPESAKPTEPVEPPSRQNFKALEEAKARVEAEKAELQKQLSEQREQWARLDERRQTMLKLQEQATQQAEAAKVQATRPDPDVDPTGARLWDIEQQNLALRQQLGQFQQQVQQTLPQFQQQLQNTQIESWVQNDVARVTAAHPDYPNALNHLRTVRIGLNKALGYNDQQAEAMWNLEVAAYTRQALENRVSIADFAYQMAKAVGYQGPQANGNGAPAPNGNGGAAAANKARVEQLQAAQKVQGLGGRESQGETQDYSQVRNMSAAQFAAYLDQIGDEGLLELPKTNPGLYAAVMEKFSELG